VHTQRNLRYGCNRSPLVAYNHKLINKHYDDAHIVLLANPYIANYIVVIDHMGSENIPTLGFTLIKNVIVI
jgi:hypothetical protein